MIFGLTVSVNEAVEQAHVDGVLGQASLMVAAPAAADAVRRAKTLPSLKTGLHLFWWTAIPASATDHLQTSPARTGASPPTRLRSG